MDLRPRLAALAILILGGLASACAPGPLPAVADGWKIGDPVDSRDNPECDEFVPAAIAGFDRRDPGHLPIISVALHQNGVPGSKVLNICSGGCPVVAVFQLADGSVRAIGVGTPGIATEPMVFNWGDGRAPR